MFSHLYSRELRFLREMGQRFASAHPNTAGSLTGRSDDPDVARLEEGIAYTWAQAHERLDAEMPESVRGLWHTFFPHYLRSLPACSVVEFSPDLANLRGPIRIPAGYEVASIPIEKTSCRFRLALPCDLLPLAVESASFDKAFSGSPLLRVIFQSAPGGLPRIFGEQGIRLFLHDEFAVTTTLWLWLMRHCRAVTVRGLMPSGQELELGPEIIHPVGFEPDQALLPWPRLAPEWFRLAQEYFTLPQKFLFVDLRPLPAAGSFLSERFEIAFRFDSPPDLPGSLSPGIFRLHCAPVINLFRASAEPIRSDLPGAEHVLRPAGVDPDHAEVYSADSVVGLKPDGGERREHPPFHQYKHVNPENPGGSSTFSWVRRELSRLGGKVNALLSVTTPRDVVPDVSREVLSADLTCTNGALAARVRSGDISMPMPGSSPALPRGWLSRPPPPSGARQASRSGPPRCSPAGASPVAPRRSPPAVPT